MKFKKEIAHAQVIPDYYGIAYSMIPYGKMTAICYPIPFNFLARWLHLLKWWLKRYRSDEFDRLLESEYTKGLEQGRRTKVRDTLKEIK